jgi:multiple sugar transport system permease protein
MRIERAAPGLLLRVVCYSILVFWLLVVSLPLYWVLITSFKTVITIRMGASYLPWVDFVPVLDNWRGVLIVKQADLLQPLKNSLLAALGGTTLAVTLGSLAGYGSARFNYGLWGLRNEGVAFMFLSQRMFPPLLLVLPFLLLFRFVGLLDTLVVLALVYGALNLPLVVWITRDVFASLPREIEESALIDGCSRWQAFVRIALPLSLPGLSGRPRLL